MKYLKKFEKLIKSTDKRVLDNPTKGIVDKLKELTLKIKDIEGYHSDVRVYYTDKGDASIVYYIYINKYVKIEILKMKIYKFNDRYTLTVKASTKFGMFNRGQTDSSGKIVNVEFVDFLKDQIEKVLKKYIKSRYYEDYYKFKLKHINDIILKLNEIDNEIDIQANIYKFNL